MRTPTLVHRIAGALALVVIASSGCSPVGSATQAPNAPSPTPPAAAGNAAPPVWQPGDRWTFEWTSGTDNGTKTAEVVEIHTVGGIPYYVVRLADSEHYYTRDLHWAFAVREKKVEARMLPALPWFTWPLENGRRWTHRGTFESASGVQSHLDTFRVTGAETVEVGAGRFDAVKVVREGERGDSDEYWYAPPVRWYVRWVGRRGSVQFEEKLRSYDPAPRGR